MIAFLFDSSGGGEREGAAGDSKGAMVVGNTRGRGRQRWGAVVPTRRKGGGGGRRRRRVRGSSESKKGMRGCSASQLIGS